MSHNLRLLMPAKKMVREPQDKAGESEVIKESVQSLPHGGEITPATTSEPPTSDQQVDFGLAQLNRDAFQPLPSAIAMSGHAVSARRGRGTIGRAIAY